MSEIKLTFTLEEVNTILASLGKQPYEAVFTIVEKIKEEATPQIKQNVNLEEKVAEEVEE
jgi:hypothetical protein